MKTRKLSRSNSLAFIYGTRPEIIKLSPLIRECQRRKIPFFSVHTGQHYSYTMDTVFFKELGMPFPEYRLKIKSTAPWKQGEHTGRMLIDIENILLKEMPRCVIVQGDTNSVLAGALCAEKISTTKSFSSFYIKVAHVEAGLRSFDRSMPEEINRFIADHLSDYLFVPTSKEKETLLGEGVPPDWIHITGNTIVDAVTHFAAQAEQKSSILKTLRLNKGSYILLTLHRQENVDCKNTFSNILEGIAKVSRALKLPVVFPIHPRTAKMVKKFRLKPSPRLKIIEPTGFLNFLYLEACARLLLTDSGGVQEEGCVLKVPCVTLRNNTERPETVLVGANKVAGTSPEAILEAAITMSEQPRTWKNPLGDGRASERIADILYK